MSKSVTYEGETDEIKEQSISTNTITVGYGTKVGRPNYGNEEASLFFQVDVTEDDDLASLEAKVRATQAFAVTLVNATLGVDTVEDENGVVRQAPQAEAPKKVTGGARKATSSAPKASSADKESLWQDVIDSPDDWYDNRGQKKNPNGPDFKHKQSGDALWLYRKGSKTQFASDVPEFVKLWVNGEAEAA